MTLLAEIEDGAASDGMSLATLLRKCMILASRLGSKAAEDWVEWELNGYPLNAAVPDYRVLPLTIKANLADIARSAENYAVPPHFLGDNANEWTQYKCRYGIGAIEHLLSNGKSTMALEMGNLPLFLNARKFTSMQVICAWGETDASHLKQIIETVRSRVLKFILDLGKEYPDAGMVKSTTPPAMAEKADQIFINNIYGPANVIGNAHNSSVMLSIIKGDFASLSQALESKGIARADIDELQEALTSEPEPMPTGFGPKVSAWLGKMMTKASDGTWLIGTGAAGDLLSRLLSKFYGLG